MVQEQESKEILNLLIYIYKFYNVFARYPGSYPFSETVPLLQFLKQQYRSSDRIRENHCVAFSDCFFAALSSGGLPFLGRQTRHRHQQTDTLPLGNTHMTFRRKPDWA